MIKLTDSREEDFTLKQLLNELLHSPLGMHIRSV